MINYHLFEKKYECHEVDEERSTCTDIHQLGDDELNFLDNCDKIIEDAKKGIFVQNKESKISKKIDEIEAVNKYLSRYLWVWKIK